MWVFRVPPSVMTETGGRRPEESPALTIRSWFATPNSGLMEINRGEMAITPFEPCHADSTSLNTKSHSPMITSKVAFFVSERMQAKCLARVIET